MTYCTNCGAQVPSAFCPQCGAPAVRAPQQQPQPSPLQPGLGIAAIIVAVLSLGAGLFLYLRSEQIMAAALPTDPYPFAAIRLYDLSWVILLAGGGVAAALAGVSIFLRGYRRVLGIVGAVIAVAVVAFGGVLAAG